MRKFLFLTGLAWLAALSVVKAQHSVVNVNHLTGAAGVSIPVYTVASGQVTLPISLAYTSGNGVKPKDVEGSAGMGWNLVAGGQINRVVHGLPDDAVQDEMGNFRLGLIYNSYSSSYINGFTIQNTDNTNCAKEDSDITYINTNFTYELDNAPDDFYVNAPGLNCKLLWDVVHEKFQTIPYMDVNISYTKDTNPTDAEYGEITSFTITNDKGITYQFAAAEVELQTAFPKSGGPGTYLQNTYDQYENGIVFNDNWFLTKMTDANGNGVRMTYSNHGSTPKQKQRIGADEVQLYAGAASGGTTALAGYTMSQTVYPQLLDSVITINKDITNQVMLFSWMLNTQDPGYIGTNQWMVSLMEGMGHDIRFAYSDVGHTDASTIYVREFLRNFIDYSTNTPVNYNFTYLGETNTGGAYTTTLSDSTSAHIDYWGYYSSASSTLVPSLYVNPSDSVYQRYAIIASSSVGSMYTYSLTASTNRNADTTNVMTGMLSSVKYAEGGTTKLVYQSNDYLDPLANVTVKGGGARVKQLINYDNVTAVSDTTSYFYTDPSTGKSSGKPVSLPVYGFTTPYTGGATGSDFWNYSTIRSENDLSSEDHTIMFGYVKTSHSGAGSTLEQYYLPAMNWDTIATPGCAGCSTVEWRPTLNYIARPTCANYGPIKNGIDTYPFAPNPNYDFERGLPVSTKNYNGSGGLVGETDYTYVRRTTPTATVAFVYDLDNNGTLAPMSYTKYIVYYGGGEQAASITQKVYDTQGLGQVQQSVVNYTYGGTYHKLLTQQATNSDGSVNTLHYTYTKDYSTGTHTNPNVDAIYNLQQLNINAPVETYSTVQRGATTVVTSSSLILYNSYPGLGGAYIYMPSQQLQLVQPNGLASGSFTPFSLTSSSITYDSHYYATANYTYYDFTGRLQTTDNAHKQVQGVYMDFFSQQPAITVKNAAAAEITFDDFDSDLTPEWTASYSPTLPTPTAGGHTGNYVSVGNGQMISYTLQKNAQAVNYIFSTWINSSSSCSFAIGLSGGGTSSATLSVPSTGGNWKYFQQALPMNAITAGTFTLTATLTSSGSIGLDDIIVAPQQADVATYAYDPTTHFRVAATNTNGVSGYNTTDIWGRLLIQYDQDQNIVQRNTYVVPSTTPGYTEKEVVTVSGITTAAQVDTLGLARKQTSKAYYDGLGRSLQSIAVQASPLQNDLIQAAAYDYTGRPEAAFLPYAGTGSDTTGHYRWNAISTAQPAFYRNTAQYLVPVDSAAYNQQVLENSPLQRVLSAGSVGKGFQPVSAPLTGYSGAQHYSTLTYRFNTATDSVLRWGPDGTWQSGGYNDTTLSVTTGTDADTVKMMTFTDRAGRTVLKRQIYTSAKNYDTYYVYNNAGMLAYIIPPKAIQAMKDTGIYSLALPKVLNLIFTYSYDGFGRPVSRKVPGKGPQYVIYDPLFRPVLVTDSNQLAAHKWNYIKYDVRGRAISQGIYLDNTYTTPAAMQAYVDGMGSSYTTAWFESRGTSSGTGYYTNNIFPTSGITPLAYSYFDDYDLNGDGTPDYTYGSAGLPNEVGATTAPIQGMPTMTLKSTISNTLTAKWLLNVVFYDKNLRAVQGQGNNLLNYTSETTITDTTTTVPDFTGATTAGKIIKNTGTPTTVITTPTYDNQRRVLSITQRYNSNVPVTLAKYHYNELGQLTQKGLGIGATTGYILLDSTKSIGSTGVISYTATDSIIMKNGFTATAGAVFTASIAPATLQTIDYRYNIRGQLVNINNSKLTDDSGVTQDDPNALFGMQLLYNTTDSNLGNTAYFSGRLSAVKWMTKNSSNTRSKERAFKYSYDKVDRYTAENYAERDSSSTSAFSLTHGWDEGVSNYDENGNIMALHRNATTQGSGTYTAIDQLKYTYNAVNPNQLYAVTDTTGNIQGFGIQSGGSSSGHYTYDANGNLTADPYKALALVYNLLNKTDSISFTAATGKYIKYVYGASGEVLRKIAVDSTVTTTTDYIDGFVFVNGTLSYFPTAEGRVVNNGGTLTNEYIISDQQGNARISFNNSGTGNSGRVIQENSYYGFGMVMPGSTVGTPTPQNRNLYNGGSEWQNQFNNNQPGYYETFFRNYDAAIGRFVGVDPEAESAESMTSYQYAGNNPVANNDPLGSTFIPKAVGVWTPFGTDFFADVAGSGDGGGAGGYYAGSYAGDIDDTLFGQMEAAQNEIDQAFKPSFTQFLNNVAASLGDGSYSISGDNISQAYNSWGAEGSTTYNINANQDNNIGTATFFDSNGNFELTLPSSDNTSSIEQRYVTDKSIQNGVEVTTFGYKVAAVNSVDLTVAGSDGSQGGVSDEQVGYHGSSGSWDDNNTVVNNGQKIVNTLDHATTTANIAKFVGQETKAVRWTGLKTAGVIADITGLASIGYNVRDGINDYKAGNYRLAIWDGIKGLGTTGFLLFGGEEATVAVRGGEILWNLATTYEDTQLGR